ncbi:triose-phosphate transporter family-domain-containing protein [Cladochytrium replicatum]|nr:triose-phosphate transporter family-domain-containing protein [Cladochytrium replicatum]
MLRRTIEVLDSSAGWMMAYFCLNLSITIYNKVILQMFKFKYPRLLTALHAFCSVIGAYLTVSQNVFDAPRRRVECVQDLFVMMAFSVLYTVNIATSNVSLSLVSLPFHQIVRSTNPAITVILEKLIFSKRHSNLTYCSLAMVIAGVGMATLGEYDFSALGFLLTCLGVLLSALKGVATNVLLVGRLRLHPMDLLMRMSSLACLQCLLIAYVSGEYDRMLSNGAASAAGWLTIDGLLLALLANGVLAFFLNYVSFTANKKTSALSMTVAGNVKQALGILLSMWVFGFVVDVLNGVGILVTLFGGAWYSSIELATKVSKRYG